MIYASGNQILKTIHADDTLASVFNDTGVLYQIDGGILTINNTNSNFVVSMSQELSGALKLNTEEGYYLEEITSYETTTISSTQTNTIWETTTTSTTQTSTIWETTTSSTTKTDNYLANNYNVLNSDKYYLGDYDYFNHANQYNLHKYHNLCK